MRVGEWVSLSTGSDLRKISKPNIAVVGLRSFKVKSALDKDDASMGRLGAWGHPTPDAIGQRQAAHKSIRIR